MEPIPEVAAGPWSRKALLWVLLVSLAVRVVWMLSVNTMPVTDFWWYYQRAISISAGDGYSVGGAPTAYWPVGYSGFLALFFSVLRPTITLAKVLNLALILGSIAVSFRIAHRLFRSNAVAVVSSLLLSLHFNWIAYSGILASEPLYTFLTLYGTWMLLTTEDVWGKTVIGGFAFGLATLVRPVALLLPAIVLFYGPDRIRLRNAPGTFWAAYLMVVLVVMPWTFRNYKVMGSPVAVSTNLGDNLLIGNSPDSTGAYLSPTRIDHRFQESEVERNTVMFKSALEYAVENPARTVALWPAKVWNSFGRSSDGPYWSFMKVAGQLTVPGVGDDKTLFLAAKSYAGAYHAVLLMMFLAASLAFISLKKRVSSLFRVTALGYAMIGYAALVSIVFFGNPRFAFPVLPYVCMYAAALIVLVWRSLQPVYSQT